MVREVGEARCQGVLGVGQMVSPGLVQIQIWCQCRAHSYLQKSQIMRRPAPALFGPQTSEICSKSLQFRLGLVARHLTSREMREWRPLNGC